ncbi:predicted protein [Histoplasma mississippiense (nom. inval.)]|uniref:predicted protein n=1 Tax=Ajellomyces capsulatus (strain NAm1 / WU24) TaxID=2059318 RepID=UPI000157D0EA|nr:predicted protein [Histoplasma mississippiense (nom. inval.)]EDN11069.1 predicted protein [Histoplasma mississippiense (nom. inval.)]
MSNTNHGIRRLSSTSSDVKGGGNTSQQDEIMEIHSQVLKMIEIFERMSAMLETIETRIVTRPCTSANRNELLPCGAHGYTSYGCFSVGVHFVSAFSHNVVKTLLVTNDAFGLRPPLVCIEQHYYKIMPLKWIRKYKNCWLNVSEKELNLIKKDNGVKTRKPRREAKEGDEIDHVRGEIAETYLYYCT